MASLPRTSWRWDRKARCAIEIVAQGRMAHSAYPHLGESAIEKLLDALERVRQVSTADRSDAWAEHAEHRHHQGGRAPNVIPDHARRKSSSAWWTPAIARGRQSPKPCAGLAEAQRGAVHSGGASGIACRASRPPWSPTPPTFRPSTERGASRSCSARAAFTVAHTDEERIPKARNSGGN